MLSAAFARGNGVMIDAALNYAKSGLSVFPVGPDCRTPLVGCDKGEDGEPIPQTGGVKKATTDPVIIREWWSRWPTANLACAMGGPSGAFGLDIDRKNGVDGLATLEALEARHGPLPLTWTATTPSGGEHRWFKHDPRVSRNRVGFLPGLDVRTTGGSLALPPSRKPTGAYVWKDDPAWTPLAEAPAWLIEAIDPPPEPQPAPKPLRISSSERGARYIRAIVDDECGELARLGPGCHRNQRLFMASATLGSLVGAGVLGEASAVAALERAAEENGYARKAGNHAVRATIQSGLRRGIANPREICL